MTPTDIPRVALVEYASFENTATGRYIAPHHKLFPDDALHWYTEDTVRQLRSGNGVCLVIEDTARVDESDFTDANISDMNPSSAARLPSDTQRKVVVGYASCSFDSQKLSHRMFQFNVPLSEDNKDDWPQIIVSQGRDTEWPHANKHSGMIATMESKHL